MKKIKEKFRKVMVQLKNILYSHTDLPNYECKILTENTTKLLSYDEVKEFIDFCFDNNCFSSLLLGNGFSMACNQNFDLSNLTNDVINSNSVANNIFKYLQKGNPDIEETMRIVDAVIRLLQHFYDINPNVFDSVKDEMNAFTKKLKNQFIKTIQDNHIQSIENSAKISAFKFIDFYNHIFTLNYDLLLYWVTSHNWETFADGFRRVNNDSLIFNHNFCNKKPFYFLHGALHLFYDRGDILKLQTSIPYYSNILDEINKKFENNQYPICVTAGTADEKLEMIKNNYYLSHCLNVFRFLDDYNLVIFGTYLKDNDKHIREAILNNGVKNIFFGVSNYGKIKLFEDFIQQAKNKKKNVFFYDYNSVDVWGNKSNL